MSASRVTPEPLDPADLYFLSRWAQQMKAQKRAEEATHPNPG
ncbi:hypothetical protein Salmuc_04561 [Salipiger mucosus DSM 16094]|uniref:Uncharacterized protein n=1 Tax=Salipiger mucosus DSM 16094 TaxID=1123237 RepID=S9Q7S8_9RHOB|nr:hypothetical protein Salmuc_04561 [Salipiger mucosus DSM 16094]